MKKKIKGLGMGLLALFLVLGMAFCIMRPAYVKEAVGILLGNELVVEPEAESSQESSSEESQSQ